MKIKSIHLQDFKRFTDLTISDLPETAKLVVLIGPNGCGKSSVFDALHAKAIVEHHWGWQHAHSGYWNKTYSLEDGKELPEADASRKISISFHGISPTDSPSWMKAVYARSAYRNDPVVLMQRLNRVGAAVDEHRFARMIENDAAVGLNYQRLASDGYEDAYEKCDGKMTLDELRERLVGDLRGAVHRLFDAPLLHLNGLGSPLKDGTFRFNKGSAKEFLYENLSGGEKSAFDLILDLVVKRREYNDTVFCIDEPEAHLGMRLQAKLLKELYRLIPDNCQLWIATHSIGMMRAAYDLGQDNPETVIFLDFDKRDFDQLEVVITPSKINRTSWENMHRVVLEDLAALLAPNKIILCEGKHGQDGLDAQCYNTIFKEEHPDTLFVSTGGKGEGTNYSAVIKAIVEAEVILLRDKDNLSPQALEKEKAAGKRVLRRTKIEDYLLDDENLRALCEKHAGADENKVLTLLQLKQSKLQEKGDIKAIVNDLRQWTINSLGVQNAGDTYSSFLQDTIAPLIKPDMKVFKELEEDIFVNESTA